MLPCRYPRASPELQWMRPQTVHDVWNNGKKAITWANVPPTLGFEGLDGGRECDDICFAAITNR